MTYNEFHNIVNVLFEAVETEAQDDWTFDDWSDMAHQVVDGCAEVIYTATAWDLVSTIRHSAYYLFADAEEALDSMGMTFDDIDQHITALSYQILNDQVMALVEAKYYPVEA
jgi:hypothetical protein